MDNDNQLAVIQSQLGEIQVSEISTNEQYDDASRMLVEVKNYEKALKADKDTVLKPLNAALKAQREKYKPVEAQVEALKRALQTEMSKYSALMQKQQEEAAAQATEAFLNDNDIAMPEVAAPVNPVGVRSYTNKQVKIDWDNLTQRYQKELLERPAVREVAEKEIRKDALGVVANGVEPRKERGVEVVVTKEVR